jgi:hypothetical protein
MDKWEIEMLLEGSLDSVENMRFELVIEAGDLERLGSGVDVEFGFRRDLYYYWR